MFEGQEILQPQLVPQTVQSVSIVKSSYGKRSEICVVLGVNVSLLFPSDFDHYRNMFTNLRQPQV